MSTIDPYILFKIQGFYVTKGEDQCWEYFGHKDTAGYGQIWYQGRLQMVSRVLYEHYYGPFDDSLLVCHKCDNPACVNHKHLFIGTKQDNATDRNNKNRQAKGETHSKAKLTEKQVLEIRFKYLIGLSVMDLSKEYKVTHQNINSIIKREYWKHI